MVGTAWNEDGMGYGRSKLKFLDQFGGAGRPQFWPSGAQKGQNGPTMPKNGDFKVLMVLNGWNSVE